MRRVLKWTGILLAGLLGILLLLVVVVHSITERRFNRRYQLEVEALAVANEPAAIERGQHLTVVRDCVGCHGADLSGRIMLDEPRAGRLVAGNLTPGKGGVGAYSDADWVRAIRHGIAPDGRALIFMPSHEFYYLSDADLADMIAFLKSLPSVNRELPDTRVAPPMRALFLFTGQPALLSAELIDHEAPRPVAPKPGVTTAYGRYLVVGCRGCHGEDLAGGPIPGMPPDWPEAPNLTPGGELDHWSAEDFITTMRTGVSPHGHELNNDYMPWQSTGQMTDDELTALFLYLQTLPAVPTDEAHEHER